jgi:hypothetical protein
MAGEKSTGASGKRVLTIYEEDERAQAVALLHVLELHPAVTFTRAELLVELSGGGAPGYLDSEAIERASASWWPPACSTGSGMTR